MMEWLFGHRKTPAELLKENQRSLRKAMRELDREKGTLEKQEIKVTNDIRKAAKAGQMDATRIMAKDLVRTRKQIKKLMMMRTQIQTVSLKIQTLKSTHTMAEAMKGVTKAMGKMNKTMNLPALQKIMMEFEKQNELMDMKTEIMDDTIDEVLGDDDEEEETDEIVNQVFDELGLSLDGQLASAPGGKLEAAKTPAAAEPVPVGADADLQARLDNLRRE